MSYSNNISPGNAPLKWSNIREAFDQINVNFTELAGSLAGGAVRSISNATQANPVVITTSQAHSVVDGERVIITDVVGMIELNGNTYYANVLSPTTYALYSEGSLSTSVDGTAFTAYASGGSSQKLTEFSQLNFEAFASNILPSVSGDFSLGSDVKEWAELHIAEASDTPGNLDNGLWIGSAQVTGSSGVINLPPLSTVDGELIIDPNKTFFKEVQVDNDNVIVASDFVDSLNLISGTAIQMSVDSSAESITIDNIGVTQLTGSTGISVSASTGNITLSNTGVTSITNNSTLPAGLPAGAGLAADLTTGAITLTNTGVIDVDAGFGITISRDDATGIVTVTNSAPAQVAFRIFRVSGQNDIVADSTADAFTFEEGYGIIATTDAGTDTITLSVDNNIDINGSVFANDSTLLVDALEGRIVADVYADVFGNVTGNVVGDVTGNLTGDIKGSVFADDSSLMVDAVDNKIYANELWGTIRGDTWNGAYDGFLSIINGGATGPGPIQIVASANLDLTAGSGYTINANRNIVASGGITGYHTGDMTGSVFADDSTLLVNAIDGNIPAENLSGTATIDIRGSVFGDDSTVIIDGATSTVTGKIAPNGATPGGEFEDGELGEIRVDDTYIWVKTPSTGAWKKIALTSF